MCVCVCVFVCAFACVWGGLMSIPPHGGPGNLSLDGEMSTVTTRSTDHPTDLPLGKSLI